MITAVTRHVFTGVLKYAYELLTLDTFMKLPGDLQVRDSGGGGLQGRGRSFSRG